MNNKTLLILFLLLLGIYGLTKVFSGKKEKSFKTELIQVDTSKVSQIVIKPKAPEQGEITLKKEATGWIASQGNINVKATQNAVNSLLGNLVLIKTKHIAANKEEKWPDYEVQEGQGTLVKVYQGEKLLEDFVVGRFSYNQQTQSGLSYLRLNGEKEVYAVDGFLTLTFGQQFNSYRNRGFLKMNPEMEITEFTYQRPDTSLNFVKANGQWVLNGLVPIDSTKMATYLSKLANLSGNDFADDFDELQAATLPSYSLSLKGNNILEPLSIHCYQDTSRAQPFVFRSNQNTEAYFSSDSTGLFKQVFIGLEESLE